MLKIQRCSAIVSLRTLLIDVIEDRVIIRLYSMFNNSSASGSQDFSHTMFVSMIPLAISYFDIHRSASVVQWTDVNTQ